MFADRIVDRADKITRALDRDHSSVESNDFGKIDSRVAGTGADIERATPARYTRSLPTIQNYRTPGTMLDSQSLQLLIVRAEDVIAFL